jgi:hypothetical protein
MSIQTINIGGFANDGTGDDLRTAFLKVNANFAELGGVSGLTNGENLGSGVGVFAQRNATDPVLEFKTLISSNNSINIDGSNSSVINLTSSALLVNDPSPRVVEPVFNELGGITNPLDLQGNEIIRGNVRTTVFNLDIRVIDAVISLMLASNSIDIDFGTFEAPTGSGSINDQGIVLDMNGNDIGDDGFAVQPAVGIYDFGTFV